MDRASDVARLAAAIANCRSLADQRQSCVSPRQTETGGLRPPAWPVTSTAPPAVILLLVVGETATSCRTTSTDDATAVSPSFWAYATNRRNCAGTLLNWGDDTTVVPPSFWAFVVESTELCSDAIELKLRRLLAIVCGALAGSLFQVNCRLSAVNYLRA